MNKSDISNGVGQSHMTFGMRRTTCRFTTVALLSVITSLSVANGTFPLITVGIGILVFILFTVGSWALREAVKLNARDLRADPKN